MFTLDADRRLPSVVTHADPFDHLIVGPLPTADCRPNTGGDTGNDDTTVGGTAVDERRFRLSEQLDDADTAIVSGRMEDAHRALIRAQDMVIDLQPTPTAGDVRRRRSTDLHLRLIDLLVDANRLKDRAIIAECRTLLDLLADICGSMRPASEAKPI